MILILLFTVVCLVLVHDFLRKCGYRWKKLSEFPGDRPLPLVGNALQLGFDADESSHKLMALWAKHGKVNFRMSVGSEDWILLSNVDDVGTILNHTSELTKPLERNTAMKPFFGNSVSSSEGDRWRTTRKLMTPSFHFNTLEKRVDDVNTHCVDLFRHLDEFVGKDDVEIYKYLKPYMFDILSESLMGVESNFLNNLDHPYLKAGAKVIRIVTENYFSYWRNIRPIFVLTPIYTEMMDTIRSIRATSSDIINRRRAKINQMRDDLINNNLDCDVSEHVEKKLNDNACLLDKFLLGKNSKGEPIPDDVISDEVTLVCYTGHYTTTMTMAHTLYCLAKYPEIQKKVIEEQRQILNNDLNRIPTNQELNQMKYLEAVIKESIRVIPTVTKIGRQLQQDLKFKDGRVAPAGTSVIVFYEAMYADPKIFPEPEKYDPERFLGAMHTFAFVPFSAGPRNCIGFRYAWVVMKSTLSHLLRRYEFLPGSPGMEPQFAYRIVTESKNGVHLKLRKRIR
ncbi:cytochrome P450 4d2-like [Aricia agestis]|uniref:cytochrome P450 4d2-like n=1 Tax=Aricia agestis TaxID=91739 RepID=UPI001C20A1E4|nr:cytochrome P450 4d2-like [Aricia agestis]